MGFSPKWRGTIVSVGDKEVGQVCGPEEGPWYGYLYINGVYLTTRKFEEEEKVYTALGRVLETGCCDP